VEARLMDVAVAYLHFIGLIALGTALAAELLYLDDASEDTAQLRRLGWVDIAYVASAILVLATGLLWLTGSTKGAAFYLHNPFFYIKVALFIAIGLVSISPTRYMLRWRREAADAMLPPPEEVAHVRRYVIAELALFVLIPLFAVLSARGIGTEG
jgi:putative membrane protein